MMCDVMSEWNEPNNSDLLQENVLGKQQTHSSFHMFYYALLCCSLV